MLLIIYIMMTIMIRIITLQNLEEIPSNISSISTLAPGGLTGNCHNPEKCTALNL